MKKFILGILVFFVGINIGNAAVVYDRNELDNYGVNKDIEITDRNKNDILNTKAVWFFWKRIWLCKYFKW